MDIYVESRLLLEKLANSIYDRDPTCKNPFFFTTKESRIVEDWIKKLMGELIPDEEMDETSSGNRIVTM